MRVSVLGLDSAEVCSLDGRCTAAIFGICIDGDHGQRLVTGGGSLLRIRHAFCNLRPSCSYSGSGECSVFACHEWRETIGIGRVEIERADIVGEVESEVRRLLDEGGRASCGGGQLWWWRWVEEMDIVVVILMARVVWR